MDDLNLPRRLWYETVDGCVEIEQSDLVERREPLIVLGEPGMGKTELLRWLGEQPGYAYCTARKFRNARPDPGRLLGNNKTLVIDALDELSVQSEGDAVDIVLQRLGDISYPPPHFVLSCRAADWRNATGITTIREQYGDIDLLVLHLKPLSDDEVRQLLAVHLDGDTERADAVILHFENVKLGGLLGNPQTLELVARVAKNGPLPSAKAELFARAVELLRKEHRDAKADRQPDGDAALDAAGAAFAALILTGSEAIVVETAAPAEDEIPLNEVSALPGAQVLAAVLGSRLFGTVRAATRFSYWHRRIGEYLGSRWLARQANTALKRKRLLALFQSNGVVPASLRSLHAWLAHHDRTLAPSVIDADPMGVIEYGDADVLDESQARLLLAALRNLAARDPRFRGWGDYSLKSVVQKPLLEDVRAIIADGAAELGLRLLLIQAIKDSPIAGALGSNLLQILQDSSAQSTLRYRALDTLAPSSDEDWPALVDSLRSAGSDQDIGLALDIIAKVDIDHFSDAVIIGLVIKGAQLDDSFYIELHRIAQALPRARLEPLLDKLVREIAGLSDRYERPGNNELTDFSYELISRRLEAGPVVAQRLLTWLEPFDAEGGYRREVRDKVHDLIKQDETLRRAGQRLLLLDKPGSENILQRSWHLTDLSPGFAPTPEDIVVLLNALDRTDGDDEKWRALLRLTRHSATEGAEVREAAKRLVANRPDMVAWIDKLTEPHVPEWKIKQEESARLRAAEREMKWREHRASFARNIDDLRRGAFNVVISPARAYLGLFLDMNDADTPNERLTEWLGEELAAAAMEGFEAFLQSDEPPTPAQMSASHAASKCWNSTAIIVAALAERLRKGVGFQEVSDERLTVAFYDIRQSRIDDHAELEGLKAAVEAEMRARELVEKALRNWIEPQLEGGSTYPDQLYNLMWEDVSDAHAADIAAEWLKRFSDLPAAPEVEMIDRLTASQQRDTLSEIARNRLAQELSHERRANWEAVTFLTDFTAQRERLTALASKDSTWLWSIRNRIVGERGRSITPSLSIDQLDWLVATFRTAFPMTSHPSGVTTGDTNPWNASEFLASVASRIADATSDQAMAALTTLRDAPADGYTHYLRALAAEQERKRAEGRYRPPALAELRAIVEAQRPQTVADLQATLLELLEQVQNRVRADPADPWRGFYKDPKGPHDKDPKGPHDEERCRDHLLIMLGDHPEGINLIPEGHLADDNRADIIAKCSAMTLPVEIKGQWHPELWRAADTQLDGLYTTDYAADGRGIYLVLWFGHAVPDTKKPRARARGRRRPQKIEGLREQLIEASQAAREGRVAVVVLDLERPPNT